MSGNDFAKIRDRVSAEDVARYAGLTIRAHRAACPFHGGTHENLSFHAGGFKCFVCGEAGSSLDFWGRYFDCDIPAAARGINDAFNLGLDLDHRRERLATPAERVSARQETDARLEDAANAWVMRRYDRLLRGSESCWSLSFNLRYGFLSSPAAGHRLHRDAEKRLRRLGREFATLRAVRWGYADESDERRAAALFAAARQDAGDEIAEQRADGQVSRTQREFLDSWEQEMCL